MKSIDPNKKKNSSLDKKDTKTAAIKVLEDISIEFKPGKLYVILGSVGSGKSSMIHACLGELSKISGKCEFSGSVGYVPQTAFNTNETVRNNIIYGKPFD